jgi:DNA-binding transcriptional MerR regulator
MSAKTEKLYYSIGEVAKMFGVNTSLIRYWEKEFGKWIKPHRSKSGSRYYTNDNIDQIRVVYELVKVEGYTLQGAKDALSEGAEEKQTTEEIRDTLLKAKALLQQFLDDKKTVD